LILATGGTGQVATQLAQVSDGSVRFKVIKKSELDISSIDSVCRALDFYNPRFLVNAAAYTAVDSAEYYKTDAFLVNADGAGNLARACAERDIPLLHLSSDYVFAGNAKNPSEPFSEDDAPNPKGIYAHSKHVGDIAVRTGLDKHIILRVSGIFSGQSPCFPRAILKAGLKLDELKVVDDQVSGPTSARSIALVIQQIVASYVENGYVLWGTYHFAQQPFMSWFEFAKTIVGEAALKDKRFDNIEIRSISTADYGAKAPRPSNSCLDSTKLRETFGLSASLFDWRPDLDLAITQIISEI
jgi:dTDP-4-dehydrorhamnose reductase